MAEEPRLEFGQDGEWVQYLEQMLQHQGVSLPTPTGKFDESMRNAVTQFQTEKGLTPDGIVDKVTWNALVRPESQSEPGAEKDPRLENFDLNAYPLLAMLAEFGEGEDAVKNFLLARGLDQDFVETMATSQNA